MLLNKIKFKNNKKYNIKNRKKYKGHYVNWNMKHHKIKIYNQTKIKIITRR